MIAQFMSIPILQNTYVMWFCIHVRFFYWLKSGMCHAQDLKQPSQAFHPDVPAAAVRP